MEKPGARQNHGKWLLLVFAAAAVVLYFVSHILRRFGYLPWSSNSAYAGVEFWPALALLAAGFLYFWGRHENRKALVRAAKVLAGVTLAALFFGLFIWAAQDHLIYRPSPVEYETVERFRQEPQLAELQIKADDGTELHGWLVQGNAAKPRPLVLMFYGQGETAMETLDRARKFEDWSAAVVDYRSYGMSGGEPSQEHLFQDALTIYDYLAARDDVDSSRIVTWGGSLGTGVAVHTAAERPAVGVILYSPYDRIAGGVADDFVPFLPTRWLLRESFDVRSQAQSVTAPLMAVIGAQDKVILPQRSMALLQHWEGPVTLDWVEEGDHDSIYEREQTWEYVLRFLDEAAE